MTTQQLKTQVYFTSERFPFASDEIDDQGPELWNDALATFLYEGLRARGLPVGEPYGEDWGMCMEIENDTFRVFIGCGPYGDSGSNEFTAFVSPHEPMATHWFRRYPTEPVLKPILAALDAVLADPSITDVRWELA
jgi:hypothetical protein